MAQYFTDFSGDTVGSAPSDTQAKRASVAGDYTVVTAGSDKNLSYSPSSGGTTARGLAYTLAPSQGKTEAVVHYRDEFVSSPASARLVLFASDSPDNEYGALYSQGSNLIVLYKRVAGSYSELARTSALNQNEVTEAQFIKVQVEPTATNNAIKAKICVILSH